MAPNHTERGGAAQLPGSGHRTSSNASNQIQPFAALSAKGSYGLFANTAAMGRSIISFEW